MRQPRARFVTVDDGLRTLIAAAMSDLGLGVTSPEIDASTNTVRKVLDEAASAEIRIGTLARLCLSLEITPAAIENLGHKALAREMLRVQPDPFTDAIRRSMEPR